MEIINRIISGIILNKEIVGLCFLLLIVGTIVAYKKHGLKRVLLGKKHDSRELIYYKENKIEWKPTLTSWKIILTGGMDILTLFLILILIILSFLYAHDIESTKSNDNLLCMQFGTIYPTEEQLDRYNAQQNPSYIPNISNITIKS